MQEKALLASIVGIFAVFLTMQTPMKNWRLPLSNALKSIQNTVQEHAPLDVVDYEHRMRRLANISTETVSELSPVAKIYPGTGAFLPFKRIVAFYGNFHSKQMGILGEYPEEEVFTRLEAEVDRWNIADPETPVIPAIHYIAVTAQRYAGADEKYRLRMAPKQIEKALLMAEKMRGIAFLDIQIGRSTVEAEIQVLDPFLKRPDVHLGLDPEFSMKEGDRPGQKIGTMDAAQINLAIRHLSKIVKEHRLPTKILVVHRFVPQMITNARLIQPTPQVQVVVNMDGWGTPSEKKKTYQICITREPPQFAGFKIFYKNDLRKSQSRLMTPEEVLSLTPRPIYIQYQ